MIQSIQSCKLIFNIEENIERFKQLVKKALHILSFWLFLNIARIVVSSIAAQYN